MFEATDPDYEARVRRIIDGQPFMGLLNARLTTVEPGRCVVEGQVDDRMTQQNGFAHAGVATSLADSAGGAAAGTLMPPGSDVLAVGFTVNLLRPAVGTHMVATGTVVKPGRTVTVCDLQAHMRHDSGDVLVLKGQQTCIRVDG